MDRLAFDLEVKLAGDEAATGTVDGYGSVFNILDRGGDVVLPGAFKASLAEWKRKKAFPPMLWQHDPYNPVGVWTDIAEDDRGLKMTGQLVLDVPQAASARALIAAGAVKGLSIGYRTKDYEIDRTTGVRRLKKVDLWEVSLVTFPMLPEALISGVKGELDPRELERALRAEGFSSGMAVKAVALLKKQLRDGADEPGHDARDGAGLIMSLRKATAVLR